MLKPLTLASGLCLALLAGACEDAAPPPQRDVMIVILDDIGWEEYEVAPTPTLDSMAERGLQLDSFYSMPACSATRYALLFGRYGFRAGVGAALIFKRGGPGADPKYPSVGGVFRDAGYSTAMFGKWHVSTIDQGPPAGLPLRHGFDTWRAGAEGNLNAAGGYYGWRRWDDAKKSKEPRYNTTVIADEVRDWWTNDDPRPKLAVVSFQAAHSPFHDPPKELVDPSTYPKTQKGRFLASITALDLELGRLLEVVDLRKTIVVVVSDNGTPGQVTLSERPAKGSVHEGGIRVPAWVLSPTRRSPGGSRALVEAVDVLATVAELCDVSVPEGVAQDSRSFAGAVHEPNPYVTYVGRRFAFAQRFVPNGFGPRTVDKRAVVLDVPRLKLIWDTDATEQLFDLSNDPLEQRPINLTDPTVQKPLAEMREYFAQLIAEGA